MPAILGVVAACDAAPQPQSPPPPPPTTSSYTPPPTSTSLPVVPRELDQAAVEEGVRKVLTESFQLKDVTDVDCPGKQPVRVGHEFTCTASVEGERRSIPVTVKTDEGRYEVGAPKPA
ncbi:DUF4333 domain-containing protein [Amycolatopsis suaedae]|uniref:DUF4333 domain-containing protein n=1 Tax=Amycolatopsis suaedae TaxID=2510978 RepID=UPI0013EF10D2|nr:DUF4333 domain-containing protein [Amycolatopsis suaedae]